METVVESTGVNLSAEFPQVLAITSSLHIEYIETQ